MYKYRKVTT